LANYALQLDSNLPLHCGHILIRRESPDPGLEAVLSEAGTISSLWRFSGSLK